MGGWAAEACNREDGCRRFSGVRTAARSSSGTTQVLLRRMQSRMTKLKSRMTERKSRMTKLKSRMTKLKRRRRSRSRN
jgi:hypothetical protein